MLGSIPDGAGTMVLWCCGVSYFLAAPLATGFKVPYPRWA